MPCGIVDLFGQGDGGNFRAGAHLAVDARVVAGDVLLDVAVGRAHQVGQRLDGVVEGAVRALVELFALRVADDQALRFAPVVVEVFDKVVEQAAVAEELV